jgi:localization factor PodJL
MAISPWSVKGIDPETREAAKVAARRAGMPVGAWLTQVIRQAAVTQVKGIPQTAISDESSAGTPPSGHGAASVPAPTMQTIFENLQKLLTRVERIEQAAERVAAPSVAPLERAMVRIAERLDRVEEGVGRNDKPARRGLFGLWR